MPSLQRPQQRRDDQGYGRFGGAPASEGFKLAAEFGKQSGGVVQVYLTVTAPGGSDANLECAEFFVHQTFDPDVIPAVFHDAIAKLNLLAWGGFTVGAWIPCKGVELELELSQLPNAPGVIREH